MNHLIHLKHVKPEGEKGVAQRPHSEWEVVVPGTEARDPPVRS